MAKRGLYANIHAKRKRIAAGSGEKMRGKNDPKRPTAKDFKNAAKTEKTKALKEITKLEKQLKELEDYGVIFHEKKVSYMGYNPSNMLG